MIATNPRTAGTRMVPISERHRAALRALLGIYTPGVLARFLGSAPETVLSAQSGAHLSVQAKLRIERRIEEQAYVTAQPLACLREP